MAEVTHVGALIELAANLRRDLLRLVERAKLTPDERRILDGLLAGETAVEIARRMRRRPSTIATWKIRAIKKLQLEQEKAE